MGSESRSGTATAERDDDVDEVTDEQDDSGDAAADVDGADGGIDDLPDDIDDLPDDMDGSAMLPSGSSGGFAAGGILGGSSLVQSLVESSRSGEGNFLFGNDRAITNPPNWHSLASTDLYNSAVNDNDPSSAQADSQSWISQAKELKQVADDLYQAITELSSAWVGQGSGAAQGALAEIASAGAKSGEAARVMGERMERQAEAAAEVKKMPPPEEFDHDKALKAILAGGPAGMAADLKEQHDKAEAVKEEQVRYFNSYTSAMSEIDSSTPSFGPESIGLGSPQDSGTTSAGSLGAGNVAAPNVAGSAGGQTPMQLSQLGGGANAAANGGAAVQGGAAQHVVGSDPVPGGSTVSADPTPPAPGQPAPSAGGGGHAALGGAALAGGLAAVGGGLAAGKQSGAVRKDEAALAEQGDADEPDDEAGFDAQPDASAAQPLDEGAESSSSATTAASSDSVGTPLAHPGGAAGLAGPSGAGTAAPMGAPMSGGMAGAVGSGSAAEEEQTQASSFLIEADPDDLFGANQSVAPPVIGEWVDDGDV